MASITTRTTRSDSSPVDSITPTSSPSVSSSSISPTSPSSFADPRNDPAITDIVTGFNGLPMQVDALREALDELQRLHDYYLQVYQGEIAAMDKGITQTLAPVTSTFDKIPHYEQKIAKLFKQMQRITARIAQLKRRAMTVQTNAHKVASNKR